MLNLLPDFRSSETDLDVKDDFHGTDGPIPVRRQKGANWNKDQEAFFQACVTAGFSEVFDQNNPDSIRVSTALAYINPVRDRTYWLGVSCSTPKTQGDWKWKAVGKNLWWRERKSF